MAVGWSTTARNDAVNAVAVNAGADWIAAFTDATASTEVTGGAYARVEATFPNASAGSSVAPQISLNIPAATTVLAIGRFTTASGGTPYHAYALPGAGESFGSAGILKVTASATQAV